MLVQGGSPVKRSSVSGGGGNRWSGDSPHAVVRPERLKKEEVYQVVDKGPWVGSTSL